MNVREEGWGRDHQRPRRRGEAPKADDAEDSSHQHQFGDDRPSHVTARRGPALPDPRRQIQAIPERDRQQQCHEHELDREDAAIIRGPERIHPLKLHDREQQAARQQRGDGERDDARKPHQNIARGLAGLAHRQRERYQRADPERQSSAVREHRGRGEPSRRGGGSVTGCRQCQSDADQGAERHYPCADVTRPVRQQGQKQGSGRDRGGQSERAASAAGPDLRVR